MIALDAFAGWPGAGEACGQLNPDTGQSSGPMEFLLDFVGDRLIYEPLSVRRLQP
jgi:hypothetical protein